MRRICRYSWFSRRDSNSVLTTANSGWLVVGTLKFLYTCRKQGQNRVAEWAKRQHLYPILRFPPSTPLLYWLWNIMNLILTWRIKCPKRRRQTSHIPAATSPRLYQQEHRLFLSWQLTQDTSESDYVCLCALICVHGRIFCASQQKCRYCTDDKFWIAQNRDAS